MSDATQIPVEAPRRTRARSDSLEIDRENVGKRVREFYDRDQANRSQETERRRQRYAKYRMWTEGRDFPWPDASDVALPDLTEKSLRVQDTLFNAVLQQDKTVSAVARSPQFAEQQDKVDTLIHHQVYVENKGEDLMADACEEFVNEPSCTIFIPWIEERKEVQEFLRFDAMPADVAPAQWFANLLSQHFGQDLADARPADPNDPWDWIAVVAENGEPAEVEVSFYTARNGDVEMWVTREAITFNGPRPMVLDYDDVLFPVESSNLQIPGPSNPDGAAHVVVRSYPTVNEIKRLASQGVYDLVSGEDLRKLDNAQSVHLTGDSKEQKDTISGVQTQDPPRDATSQRRVTRLWCFDSLDIDGDGIDEDVVITMIYQPSIVLQVKRLTEVYPFNPPRRPFAEGSFLPVKGRKAGISLLELAEGLHDAMKIVFDQMIDSNTLGITPWGLYRPQGTINPEPMAIEPGILIPTADPQRDIHVPQINNSAAQGFAINIVTMLSNMEERVAMMNDMNFGRVPAGKASALRTIGGMALLAGQGEARPERILRRFFSMLTEVWAQIHELNKRFLPRNKQIRALGSVSETQAVYQEIEDRSAISGRFDFEFEANAINMSKQAMQDALDRFGALAFSPLAFQAGVSDVNGFYRYLRDYAKALGVDPRRYSTAPSPSAEQPPITADEAIAVILEGRMPVGSPADPGGAIGHLQLLEQFANTDELMGQITPQQADLFGMWFQQVMLLAQQQMQLMEAAQQQQQQQGGEQGQPGRPAEQPPESTGQPNVSGGNELLDESMPSAGGGGEQ